LFNLSDIETSQLTEIVTSTNLLHTVLRRDVIFHWARIDG